MLDGFLYCSLPNSLETGFLTKSEIKHFIQAGLFSQASQPVNSFLIPHHPTSHCFLCSQTLSHAPRLNSLFYKFLENFVHVTIVLVFLRQCSYEPKAGLESAVQPRMALSPRLCFANVNVCHVHAVLKKEDLNSLNMFISCSGVWEMNLGAVSTFSHVVTSPGHCLQPLWCPEITGVSHYALKQWQPVSKAQVDLIHQKGNENQRDCFVLHNPQEVWQIIPFCYSFGLVQI